MLLEEEEEEEEGIQFFTEHSFLLMNMHLSHLSYFFCFVYDIAFFSPCETDLLIVCSTDTILRLKQSLLLRKNDYDEEDEDEPPVENWILSCFCLKNPVQDI